MNPLDLINQWMPVINQHLSHLVWIIPVSLLFVAILQVLYLIYLRATSGPVGQPPPPLPNMDRASTISTVETTQTTTSGYPAGDGRYYEPRPAEMMQPAYSPAPPAQAAPPPPRYAPPVPAQQPAPQPAPVAASHPAPVAPMPAPRPASAPNGAPKRFVVVAGLDDTNDIPFPSDNFGIGRYFNLEANILVAFDDKSVSRKHAVFSGDDAQQEYYLTDTNSSYGTYILVGDHFEQLAAGVSERIYNADVIQFGNNVKVRVVLPGDTRASATRL